MGQLNSNIKHDPDNLRSCSIDDLNLLLNESREYTDKDSNFDPKYFEHLTRIRLIVEEIDTR
jgi:hypothetical protein